MLHKGFKAAGNSNIRVRITSDKFISLEKKSKREAYVRFLWGGLARVGRPKSLVLVGPQFSGPQGKRNGREKKKGKTGEKGRRKDNRKRGVKGGVTFVCYLSEGAFLCNEGPLGEFPQGP